LLDVGSAEALLDSYGQWVVTVDVRSDGEEIWDALGQQCFEGTVTCPSHQIAIVVDGVIRSAPTVQTPDLPGSIQISGTFTENEARTLAKTLNGT
jgi:preprotein translocase subunit SecD